MVETIGTRIKTARERVNMNQRELAAAAGMSQPTLQRIEAGERDAKLIELIAIARGCGAPLSELNGASEIADELQGAGRVGDDAAATAMREQMLYFFEAAETLDRLGMTAI